MITEDTEYWENKIEGFGDLVVEDYEIKLRNVEW